MKSMNKTYRRGAVGVMMDEYERAAAEFRAAVAGLTEEQYMRIADPVTTDDCCRSAQTIMSHVVAAGYGYADYIRDAFSGRNATVKERAPGDETSLPNGRSFTLAFPPATIEKSSYQRRLLEHAESLEEIDSMLAYTVATLDGKWEMPEEEFTAILMTVDWGPTYDLEQLLEHAIVHILRHRRQIDKWDLKTRGRFDQ